MQYVMLIFLGSTPVPGSPEWEALSEQEQKQIYTDYEILNQTPCLTPGLPLGLPDVATTVRVADGKTLTTDGPYPGATEAISGWFVREADDLATAVAVAARVPAARLGGSVEIRPSVAFWKE